MEDQPVIVWFPRFPGGIFNGPLGQSDKIGDRDWNFFIFQTDDYFAFRRSKPGIKPVCEFRFHILFSRFEYFYFKNKVGVRSDPVTGPAFAVSQFGRHVDDRFGADGKHGHGFVPTFDHLACASLNVNGRPK